MLHAFNGGFYNSTNQSFDVSGKHYDGTTDAVEHPLGSEIWAYVPMNLLPHLKWLTDEDYTHVYYVDGKPKVFDAKIFVNDSDHPGGWGTVMVVGMRFGGGSMTVDTAANGFNTADTDDRLFTSAYVIFDITNPEEEPKVLAEIQVPDGSFSTSYPAAFKVKDNTATDPNKWFLTFGSGPNDMAGESNNNAKLYIFDLAEISNPGTSTAEPDDCELLSIGSGEIMKILACDTGIANSFIGDPISVDWDLDYQDDNVYFGVVGTTAATSGRAMRLSMNGDDDADNWVGPTTLVDIEKPVVASVTPGVDQTGQKWIYFGTGRLFDSPDQLTTATQSIYGIKEDGVTTVDKADLFNSSNVQVHTNGTVSGAGSIITFDDLEDEIAVNNDGWYLDLPLIQGSAGTDPATRVINPSALAGGVLFTTAYQPGLDLCTGEGSSRLYGLYYRTGTAFPGPAVLGTTITVLDEEISNSFIELGQGFATTPSLHTGSGNDGNEVSVFTQLSTGAVIRTEAETVFSVRSGMQAWNEPKSTVCP